MILMIRFKKKMMKVLQKRIKFSTFKAIEKLNHQMNKIKEEKSLRKGLSKKVRKSKKIRTLKVK